MQPSPTRDERPIVLLIATNTEYDTFVAIATLYSDTAKEIKKASLFGNSLDYCRVDKKIPFDKISEFLMSGERVIAIHTAETIRRSTRAIDYVAWFLNPKYIINFGTAGSLKSEIVNSGIYLVGSVVQSDFDISGGLSARKAKKLKQPYLKPGQHEGYKTPYIETDRDLRNCVKKIHPEIKEICLACSNKFVFGEEKEKIVKQFDADAIDMESIGIILSCNEEKIPALIIKCISDGKNDSVLSYYENATNISEACSIFIINLIKNIIL